VTGAARSDNPGRDRRALRRESTIEEILAAAVDIMTVDGVAGLTMSALASAMSMRPPSLYKYFPSLLSIYDALFRRGQQENLDALRVGMESAAPGLAAVRAGMVSAGRWAVANPVLAQLLFWRPVPGYRPTADAFAPAERIVDLLRAGLEEAVVAGELAPGAAGDEGMALLSTLHFGVLSQHLANDPDADWEHGVFTALHPRVVDMFVAAYPPSARRPPRSRRAPS
jgi:AcrR family transcriptional regulator